MKTLLVALVMLLFTHNAWAQQEYRDYQVYYPGTVWTSGGRTLTPAEPRNMSGIVHAEQGIAYRGAELYAIGEFWADRDRRDWNNRNLGGVGLRMTHTLKTGMVRGGIAYLGDHRRLRGHTYTGGLSVFVESWFGWGRTPYVSYPLLTPITITIIP